MSNEDTTGLTGTINRLGGALNTMMPMANDRDQRDKTDSILRDVDRNLSTLTERVAHIQSSVDKLTTKLDKMDGNQVTKEEYAFMKRWLTGTTVGLVVTFILACLACAGVFYLGLYIFQGGM